MTGQAQTATAGTNEGQIARGMILVKAKVITEQKAEEVELRKCQSNNQRKEAKTEVV